MYVGTNAYGCVHVSCEVCVAVFTFLIPTSNKQTNRVLARHYYEMYKSVTHWIERTQTLAGYNSVVARHGGVIRCRADIGVKHVPIQYNMHMKRGLVHDFPSRFLAFLCAPNTVGHPTLTKYDAAAPSRKRAGKQILILAWCARVREFAKGEVLAYTNMYYYICIYRLRFGWLPLCCALSLWQRYATTTRGWMLLTRLIIAFTMLNIPLALHRQGFTRTLRLQSRTAAPPIQQC